MISFHFLVLLYAHTPLTICHFYLSFANILHPFYAFMDISFVKNDGCRLDMLSKAFPFLSFLTQELCILQYLHNDCTIKQIQIVYHDTIDDVRGCRQYPQTFMEYSYSSFIAFHLTLPNIYISRTK